MRGPGRVRRLPGAAEPLPHAHHRQCNRASAGKDAHDGTQNLPGPLSKQSVLLGRRMLGDETGLGLACMGQLCRAAGGSINEGTAVEKPAGWPHMQAEQLLGGFPALLEGFTAFLPERHTFFTQCGGGVAPGAGWVLTAPAKPQCPACSQPLHACPSTACSRAPQTMVYRLLTETFALADWLACMATGRVI